MYRISEEKIISLDSTAGTCSVEATLFASSAEDIPAYDDIPGRILVPGSIAIVPGSSALFVLDFDNSWAEWGAEPEEVSGSIVDLGRTVLPDRSDLFGDTEEVGQNDRDEDPEIK